MKIINNGYKNKVINYIYNIIKKLLYNVDTNILQTLRFVLDQTVINSVRKSSLSWNISENYICVVNWKLNIL